MTEIFDMNIDDLFGEDSEFVEGLQGVLEDRGIEIDTPSLAAILHEYESAKMEFLKAHIMKLLEDRGGNFGDGPVKVVVSQSGIDFETIDQDDESTDINVIS